MELVRNVHNRRGVSEYLTINSGAEAFNEGGGDVNVAEYGKLNCAEKEKNISRKPQISRICR